MILLEIIKKIIASNQEHNEYIAKQYQDMFMRKRYWQQYWFIALVLDEAINAKLSSLKVNKPNCIKELKPDCVSKDPNEFWFLLERNSQNTPDSDFSVFSHEVVRILEKYFKTCRFANLKVICKVDPNNYYITIRMLENFRFGLPLASGIGEIFYNPNLYNYYTNSYGMYDIAFFNGGTYGGLIEGKRFLLYYNGTWSKTGVAFNDHNFQILSLTGKHMENYIGWIVRI